MRSVCLFASYFTTAQLPYYIGVYLAELKKHFGEVILLNTQKQLSAGSLDFLNNLGIGIITEENEGFDFGLWYKAFQKINAEGYDQVALVNDSCILFRPLNEVMSWSRTNPGDLQGITFSEAIAPHLQSYFLILNKRAIKPSLDYFNTHKIIAHIGDVIRTYEVGLCTHLLAQGLSMNAFADNNGYRGEFSPYYYCVEYHLAKGVPLIKKKILFSSYRRDELFTLARMNFNISAKYYTRLIKKHSPQLLIDFARLENEEGQGMSPLTKTRYHFTRLAIQVLKPLYKKIKRA